MIDSIGVMKVLKTIIQPNIKFLGISIILLILATRHLEQNVIFIISIVLYLFIYYKQIGETFKEIQAGENKVERLIEDNRRVAKELHFSDELTKDIHKLRKMRKYSPQSYDEGYKYIKMYMYIIHDLEHDDIAHPRQYFENAQLYLKKSLNYFQAMTLSVPEETYSGALKYNKMKPSKLSTRIGMTCKRINTHCTRTLYNLSLRFNEDFFENTDRYKTEINMNAAQVEESNTFEESWELY